MLRQAIAEVAAGIERHVRGALLARIICLMASWWAGWVSAELTAAASGVKWRGIYRRGVVMLL